MATSVERFTQKFSKSRDMYIKGSEVMPGASPASRVAFPFPIYTQCAKGPLKWDIDGNEIIDYVMGSGALLLGHDHPVVIEALQKQLGQGIHTIANPLALRWAELIKTMVPSAEKVRFTGSGTESTYLALRLARAYTGRKSIVKFRNHFHGWHDYVTPESGLNTEVGIPEETLSTVIVLDPDIQAVGQLLNNNDDVAAIILEATGGHWGQFPLPNPRFLQDLRNLTDKHNVVMIMDEVITGFRTSRGGAQQKFNVLPDLTAMSKIVGGGLAAGVVAGKAKILDLMVSKDNSRRVVNTGTFNATPLAAAAGIASLELVASDPINERADIMAERLKEGLNEALVRMEVPGHVHGVSSIVHILLGLECGCGGGICTLPHRYIAEATAAPRADALRVAMLNEGVDIMAGVGFMVSAVHSEEHIDRTISAFGRALNKLRDEGLLPL